MTTVFAPGPSRRWFGPGGPGEALEPPAGPPAAGEPAEGPFWSPQPVIGFRMWRLTPEGMRGVVQVWPGPRLEACCPRGGEAPHWGPGCRCGIYALKQARALEALCGAGLPGRSYGVVALGGRVIEHQFGYRGRRAAVLALALVCGDELICGSDPDWIGRMFTPRMGAAVAAAARGWPVAGSGLPAAGAEFLEEEARRVRLWT